MSDPLFARLGRVRAAIFDPTSYRMLWLGLAGRFVEPKSLPVNQTVDRNDTPSELDGAEGDGIPRTVFQTWKTRHSLPFNFAYWRGSFLKYNPMYRHVLWDDSDNRNFIVTRFPWFVGTYDKLPTEIFRADVIRYFFLYSFGGFYADMDSECLRPLDDLRNGGDILVGRMGRNNSFAHSIPNAVMASVPGQIFWLVAVAFVVERFDEASRMGTLHKMPPEQLTGPVLFKTVVDYYLSHSQEEIAARAMPILRHFTKSEYRFGRLKVLPPYVWYPIDWTNPAHQIFRRKMSRKRGVLTERMTKRNFQKSYVVNYWSHSWDLT